MKLDPNHKASTEQLALSPAFSRTLDRMVGKPDLHPFGNRNRSGGKDEWLTPPEIVKDLGGFDLDPCSPIDRPWPTAKTHYTIEDDGLEQKWHGRVWLNPPYGTQTFKWIQKLAAHGNGISLIFARTDTAGFFSEVWNKADGILFLEGRLNFHHVDGRRAKLNAGAPSCLVAYGANNVEALEQTNIRGFLVRLPNRDISGK